MATNNDDIEEQRRLAKDWRPDVDGPLVGPVSPTSDFIGDFTTSDPRYAKIANLASAFPHYRSMKRDGSCGFRALTFGFLLNLSRSGKDVSEAAGLLRDAGRHLDGLQELFKPRGWDAFIYEDWLAACVGLCDELAGVLLSTADSKASSRDEATAACVSLLEQRLNDEEASVEILQFLRAVTSSYMLAHADDFAPFVIDEPKGVQGWCELNVDPPSAELEEQSLLAFYKAVIERSGMPVLVHYLEQSAGEMLQVAEYGPSESEKKGVPPVHLLYRPTYQELEKRYTDFSSGHYDLLLDS